jgi:hypothetical protein
MPAIPGTWEVVVGESWSKAGPWEKCESLSKKQTKSKKTRDVVLLPSKHMVELLPSKHETLRSIPSTAKKINIILKIILFNLEVLEDFFSLYKWYLTSLKL